jgi:hypothetical protein
MEVIPAGSKVSVRFPEALIQAIPTEGVNA